MSKETKNTLLLQGSILAAAGIFTKLIGFLYRIPMANLLGNQGNGVYSIAFGIYTVTLTLSSMSLPTAVSKVVSTRLAKGEDRNAAHVLAMALLFALVMGTFSFSLLYFGADLLENLYPGLEGVETEQRLVYLNMMSMNNGKFALIQVSDSKDVDAVKSILQKRIDDMANGGAWYPEPTRRWSECSTVVTNGNYVMMVVSEQYADIVSEFNALF